MQSTKSNIWIDSRDRDLTRFANANDFSLNLVFPLKTVQSISLVSARIPALAGYSNVGIALGCIKSNKFAKVSEAGGWPTGTFAILPIEDPTNVTVIRRSSVDEWETNMESPISQVQNLRIMLYTWSAAGTVIPFPLADEVSSPALANNVLLELEVRHKV